MSDLEKAIATQLANIEKRSGKSLDELAAIIRASGLTKHGEIRDMLKRDLGLGHGDANTLTHHALKSDGQSAAAAAGLSVDDVVAGLYAGPKASLRPIHDKLMAEINKFGAFEDVAEIHAELERVGAEQPGRVVDQLIVILAVVLREVRIRPDVHGKIEQPDVWEGVQPREREAFAHGTPVHTAAVSQPRFVRHLR